jgi:hypothetical protein
MIHPVFRLAVSQPLLLAEHAAAYADLVSEELATHSARLKRRVLLQCTGAGCLLVAAVLAGVALLLWAYLPDGGLRSPWLMVLTPSVPGALGLWFLWLAPEREPRQVFANLRLQLARDAAMLRVPPST